MAVSFTKDDVCFIHGCTFGQNVMERQTRHIGRYFRAAFTAFWSVASIYHIHYGGVYRAEPSSRNRLMMDDGH